MDYLIDFLVEFHIEFLIDFGVSACPLVCVIIAKPPCFPTKTNTQEDPNQHINTIIMIPTLNNNKHCQMHPSED